MNQKNYTFIFLFLLTSISSIAQTLVIDSVYIYDYNTSWELGERIHYKYDALKNRISEKRFRYIDTTQSWEVVDSISRFFDQSNQLIEKRLEYNHTTQQWTPTDSIAQTFDQLNRVTERITYSYLKPSKRWKGEERTIYDYYKNTNEFKQQTNYGWVRFTPTGDEWIANDKIVQNFDANLDSLTEILVYERNVGITLLLRERPFYRKYDTNGNLLETASMESNIGTHTSPVWGVGYLTTYNYDHLNRVIRREQHDWNFIDNSYDGFIAEGYSYFGNTTQIDTTFNYLYNTSLADWQLITQDIHQYDAKGTLESTIAYLFNDDDSLWHIYRLTEYEYNNLGELSKTLSSLWDSTSQNWVNSRSVILALQTPNYLERFYTIQDWINNQWVNYSRWRYRKYNSALKLIQVIRGDEVWDSNTMLWSGGHQRDNYQYDPSNTYLEVYIQERFNTAWENKRKEEYFWGQLTPFSTSTVNVTPTSNCILQNPYPINSSIRCEDLIIGETYQLRVYDLLGRVTYQETFLGGSSLQMPKRLDPNLYIFTIQGDKGIVFSKKVMIQ